jgi:uncharacterized protein
VHWVKAAAVIVADLHLGKPDAFCAAGIPVPAAATDTTLGRLDALVQQCAAERLIILGDLLHARSGRSADLEARVRRWRDRRERLEITVVRGNHDLAAGDPPASWRMRCVDEPQRDGPFVLCHRPEASGAGGRLAGHVHPAVSVGFGGRRPCFHVDGSCLVLPAFGAFTGSHRVRATGSDRVFAVDGREVIEVTALIAARRRPLSAR